MSFTVSTGITVTFSSGFLFDLTEVVAPDGTRISIPTSHMLTTDGAHTFTPGKLVDWGNFSGSMAYHPNTLPPMNSVIETITITYPDSASSVWTFLGFMTTFQPTGVLETRLEATFTIKVSGIPVVS